MTTHTDRPGPESELLGALTLLVANWAAVAVQETIARRAGVTVDAVDVQPLYTLGQLGSQRASELAAVLRLSRPTMSKQLRRLADAGLVRRDPDPDDARASIVSLSAAGREAYERLVREGILIVRTALAGWDAAGSDAFAHDLSRFVAALAVDDHREHDDAARGAAEEEKRNRI